MCFGVVCIPASNYSRNESSLLFEMVHKKWNDIVKFDRQVGFQMISYVVNVG